MSTRMSPDHTHNSSIMGSFLVKLRMHNLLQFQVAHECHLIIICIKFIVLCYRQLGYIQYNNAVY